MYQLDKEAFGAFLQALRKEKGLTQRQLAEMLHVSDKAVSKWERGLSIPDTALLIPLAEQLDVTVTELLLCRRCPSVQAMAPDTVEEAVQTAINYPAHRKADRAWRHQEGGGLLWYAAALAAGGFLLYLGSRMGGPGESVATMFGLAAVIGVYFWLLTPVRLPDFYDQNQISFFYDGAVRMNLLGARFNNRNWPFVVRAARVWSCVMMVLLPLSRLVLVRLAPPEALPAVNIAYLIVFLVSFFSPLYLAARRHG